MRKVVILGATGSIGKTAIKAIIDKNLPLQIVGIVAHSSKDELITLSNKLNCNYLLTKDKPITDLKEFLSNISFDIALNGISGIDGFYATNLLIDMGVDIALANKESIVIGGDFIINKAKDNNVKIIPVDSEHSSIYHLLENRDNVDKIILTASGGPFLNKKDLSNISVEEATNHPTWKMGKKISIDSATLSNKGLEVIEAGYLFNFPPSKIDVVIHPSSIVHSLIQMTNGSYYAHLSPPDMTLPIISALFDNTYILNDIVKPLDFTNLDLAFRKVDVNQFPFLPLAYNALEKKGSYPLAYTVSNEIAVNEFINGNIGFTDIYKICEKVLNEEDFSLSFNSFDEILAENERVKNITYRILNV